MEFVINMFVALCVGTSYVIGYPLALLALLFLIAWIIDGRYKSNLSDRFLYLLKAYLPEKEEKVVCKRCEEVKTIATEDNYCSLCGKEFKKPKTSTYDIQVEKMTKKILIFALITILLYSFSTTLFVVFVTLSAISFCLYSVSKSAESKRESA